MRTIVNLILRIASLVEAEARVARESALEFAVAVLLLAMATGLVMAGLLAAGAAISVALSQVMHPAMGLAVVALLFFLLAACLTLFVRRDLRDRWGRK